MYAREDPRIDILPEGDAYIFSEVRFVVFDDRAFLIINPDLRFLGARNTVSCESTHTSDMDVLYQHRVKLMIARGWRFLEFRGIAQCINDRASFTGQQFLSRHFS